MFDFKFAEIEGSYAWINRGTEEAAPDGGFVYNVKSHGHEACLLYKLDLSGAFAPSPVSTAFPDKMTSYLADTAEEPGSDCTKEADTSPAYKSLGDKFKFCGNPRMFVYTKGGVVVKKQAIVHAPGNGATAISFVHVPEVLARCPNKMFDFKFAEIEGSYAWINRGTEEAAPDGGFVYNVKGHGHEACLLYKLDLSGAFAPSEVSTPFPDHMTSYLADTAEEPGPDCTEEADT